MKSARFRLNAVALCCALLPGVTAAASATETVLYSFAGGTNDGASPGAALVSVDGLLYGTTYAGGFRDSGIIFSVDPATGVETILHQFGDGRDGLNPAGGLLYKKGTLYGTTSDGGGNGGGGIFALNLGNGSEMTIYGFCSKQYCDDGEAPMDAVIDVDGLLYGTTFNGGGAPSNSIFGNRSPGIVFSFDPMTGAEIVLHAFHGLHDGVNPRASLLNVKGILYGTTSLGGTYGPGTVFSVDPASGTETIVHSFGSGTDGWEPSAGLIDMNGVLYGTTTYGGANDCGNNESCGTVYSVDPSTGEETVVHSFSGTDGRAPFAGLIAVNGLLYGTTGFGGASDKGTAFSLDPSSGTETVIHSFGVGSDGRSPNGGMIYVNGTLYGTTAFGGTSDEGTVFAITIPGIRKAADRKHARAS